MSFVTNKDLFDCTFLLKVGKSTATSFTITITNQQYLITAAHVIQRAENGTKIDLEIHYKKNWLKLSGLVYFHKNTKIDIVVIKLKKPIAAKFNIALNPTINLGQDLFFFGFPYGLHSNIELNRDFPFPFVKKASFSAIKKNDDGGIVLFLDGHNNQGFSGGPVGYYDVKLKKTFIVGVISSYLNHKGEINSPIGKLTYNENSGIILSSSSSHIKEIINEMN